MASKSCVFRFGDVEVREREFTLIKAGEIVPVEPKAFRVLLLLLRNPQKLIAKEELLNAVWGDAAVTENSLTRSIALLRKLLGDETRSPRYIETVATVGYRFVCKVEVSEDPSGILEPTGQPPVNGNEAEAAANESPQVNGVAVGETKSERSNGEGRGRFRKWLIVCGGSLALALAAAFWYMHRPLPPPRISEYTQITSDGHDKYYVGTDGSRLYFNRDESIAEVSITGGAIVPVKSRYRVSSPIWSMFHRMGLGDVEVREREFTLIKAGEIVPVEPKAFRVLLLLLRNPQKLIAKEELLNAVWGDAAVTENSLTRSIALLRRLLGDDTRNPRYIETVATVGYRFVCKVEVSEEASGILDPTDQLPANESAVGASAVAETESDLKRLTRDLDPGLASVSSASVAGSVATTKVRRGKRRVAMLAGAAGLVLFWPLRMCCAQLCPRHA